MIKKTVKCETCAAEYEIAYDLPEEDYKNLYCSFCGNQFEDKEDENFEAIEDRYEDWN
jgi:transcription elongation factor Elf1|tara:strand:+ start:213 stop:386 length:174 start_codon:yes stop_codon:yes gene_type:complete